MLVYLLHQLKFNINPILFNSLDYTQPGVPIPTNNGIVFTNTTLKLGEVKLRCSLYNYN